MLKLSIQDIEGRTTYVPLKDGEYSIGRDEANTICLTDRNVSRQHARVTAKGGSVWIESVSATYGTRYNNLLLREKAEFCPGDVVEIGDYKVELSSGDKRDNAVKDGSAPEKLAGDTGKGNKDSAQAAKGSAPAATASKGKAPDGATAIVNLADISSLLNKDSSAPSTAIPEASQPRLTVESENLRGLELRITKTPIVIGRVRDSSDLVIDHRSISKEHARLTRLNDGTWQVLDLGSANGIKVNGEPYSKSEIRSGDRLELGHVAMRFLAAGAKAPSVAPAASGGGSGGAKGKTGLIVGGIVAVVLLAVVAVVLVLNGKSKEEPGKGDAEKAASDKAGADKGGGDKAAAGKSGSDKPGSENGGSEGAGSDNAGADNPGSDNADKQGAGQDGSGKAGSDKPGSDDGPGKGKPGAASANPVDQILAAVDAKIEEGKYDEAKPIIEVGKMQHPGSAPIAAKLVEVEKLVELMKKLRQAEYKLDSDPAEAIAIASDVRGKVKAGSPLHEGAGSIIEMAKKKLSGKPVKAAKPDGGTAPVKKEDKPVKETPKEVVKEVAKPAEGAAKSPKEYYDEAREALGSSDYEKAIGSAKQALKGGMVKSHNVLAKAYYGKGDKGGCLKHATAADKAGVADAVVSGLLEKCQ